MLAGDELNRGQEHVKTASCSVLTGWQPTKLIHLVVVVLKYKRTVLESFGSLSTHMRRGLRPFEKICMFVDF